MPEAPKPVFPVVNRIHALYLESGQSVVETYFAALEDTVLQQFPIHLDVVDIRNILIKHFGIVPV